MDERPQYLGWVTIALWVIAVFLFLAASATEFAISVLQQKGDGFVVQILRALQVFYWILGGLVGIAALLRGIGSPVGAHLTAAVCIVVAPLFPWGTGVFLVWLLVVRPRELPLARTAAGGDDRRLPEGE